MKTIETAETARNCECEYVDMERYCDFDITQLALLMADKIDRIENDVAELYARISKIEDGNDGQNIEI